MATTKRKAPAKKKAAAKKKTTARKKAPAKPKTTAKKKAPAKRRPTTKKKTTAKKKAPAKRKTAAKKKKKVKRSPSRKMIVASGRNGNRWYWNADRQMFQTSYNAKSTNSNKPGSFISNAGEMTSAKKWIADDGNTLSRPRIVAYNTTFIA